MPQTAEEKAKYQRQQHRKRRLENPELYRKREQVQRRRIKIEILSYYSNGTPACAVCGEDRQECLSIDHIDGKGAKHRRDIGCSGTPFYYWLKRKGFPEGYNVLCMNCQFVKKYIYKEYGGNLNKLIDLPVTQGKRM